MPSRHQNKKSNKRSRKAKAGKSKKSRSNNNRSKKYQKGGNASGACVLDYSNKTNMFNASANIHNSNPQASLDLDNKFLSYGGPVPLGSSIVGGGSCGSEGVGTSNPKSDTFKEYMTRLDENLSSVTGGNPNPNPNSKPNEINNMKGSGYSYDTNEFIAGQPVVKSWDDNSPPAIIGGQLVFGSPDQPICGNGAVSGGFRRNKKSSKKRSKKNNKNTKRLKSKNMKRSRQSGGDFTTFRNSKPAEYDQAYNGPPGVFQYPDNMMNRSFEGRQPVWDPSTI